MGAWLAPLHDEKGGGVALVLFSFPFLKSQEAEYKESIVGPAV